MRIHLANKYPFKTQFTDFDEAVIAPDEGSAQLTVMDADGAEVVTVNATIGEDNAVSAEVLYLPDIGHYLMKWTATLDGDDIELFEDFELSSRPYFTIAELIAHDTTSDLDQADRNKLKRARNEAEDIIEHNCSVAFVPRSRRFETRGDGSERILLPDVKCRRVISVTVDGVPIAVSPLKLHAWGALDNPTGWDGQIVVTYEHGYGSLPQPIKTAALILATSKANLTGVPSNALSQNTDAGFVRFAIAGRDGATGIPDVDAVIEQYKRYKLAVG